MERAMHSNLADHYTGHILMILNTAAFLGPWFRALSFLSEEESLDVVSAVEKEAVDFASRLNTLEYPGIPWNTLADASGNSHDKCHDARNDFDEPSPYKSPQVRNHSLNWLVMSFILPANTKAPLRKTEQTQGGTWMTSMWMIILFSGGAKRFSISCYNCSC